MSDLSLRSFLAEVRVRYIDEEECRRFDPELVSFFNMNRPADLGRARQIAEQRQPESLRGNSVPLD